MRKIESTQRNIQFIWCPFPITLDRRLLWGNSLENNQEAPSGAFLEVRDGVVDHLVQPNETGEFPLGWVPTSEKGFFDKSDIWIDDQKELEIGQIYSIDTRDGIIKYEITEPSVFCYNDISGGPDKKDVWIQTYKQLKEHYLV